MAFGGIGCHGMALLVPELRKWLFSLWPWIAGVIALVVFSPTLIWNAEHHWASVLYQYNRLVVYEWTLRYLGEFFATQIGIATPPIFILGAMGLIGLIAAVWALASLIA